MTDDDIETGIELLKSFIGDRMFENIGSSVHATRERGVLYVRSREEVARIGHSLQRFAQRPGFPKLIRNSLKENQLWDHLFVIEIASWFSQLPDVAIEFEQTLATPAPVDLVIRRRESTLAVQCKRLNYVGTKAHQEHIAEVWEDTRAFERSAGQRDLAISRKISRMLHEASKQLPARGENAIVVHAKYRQLAESALKANVHADLPMHVGTAILWTLDGPARPFLRSSDLFERLFNPTPAGA